VRVLVYGGRDYADKGAVFAALDCTLRKAPDMIVICGHDTESDKFQGADQLAYEWAKDRGVPVATHPARWSQYGRSAGPKRNRRQMDMMPTGAIEFPGGRGTGDMREVLEDAGVVIWRPTTPSTTDAA
jgi:hypothetical protein